MNIHTNNYYNNGFRGYYVIKGNSKDVSKARKIIREACGDFCEFQSINLQKVFSDNQSDVREFIATKDHCKNAKNWFTKYVSPALLSVDRATRCSMNFAIRQRNKLAAKSINYFEAEEAMINGDEKPMKDFLRGKELEAQRTLQQIKDLATVPMGKIEELDARQVLTAIADNRFDFISGIIS